MNNPSAPFLLQLGILTKRLLLRLARRPLAELPNIFISAFFLLVYDGALGGVFGGSAQLAMTEALRLAETHVLAPCDFLRLVFISVLGYLIFDQVPNIFVLVGGIIIFASIASIAYLEYVRARKGMG